VDRVSGVTLDALTAGCPVVAVEGTWSARVVERFGAGRVVPDTSPATLLSAVRAVEAGYAALAEGARRAGRVLLEENDARALYDAVAGGAPGDGAPTSSA
jgi:UDP:flavonoid glycosyltransferase YjiC (YdhE family)